MMSMQQSSVPMENTGTNTFIDVKRQSVKEKR